MRPCPQAQFFSPKNIKTYLSCPKKGTFGGLAGVALSRGGDIPGHQKKHSFKHRFFPAAQLFPIRVGCHVVCCVGCCVVVVLLSFSLFTLLPRCKHRCRRHHWHAAATTATAVGWHEGWHYLIVWAIELSYRKNQEQQYTMALDNCQTQL